MSRPGAAAATLVAASLAACRPPEPYALPARPVTSDGFAAAFESAQQRGASDATLDRLVRSEFATIEPEVSVEPITFDELTPIVGRSTARRLLRGWVVVRATLRVRRRSAVDLPFDVTLASGSHLAPATSVDGRHLSLATGEAYPSGGSRSHLRADAPLPLIVLTGGILGLATLRVETEHLPPAEAQVRAAIPRALRLAKALETTCSPDRCSKAFVFRRPADESAPLALGVSVLLPPSGSISPDADGKAGEKAPLAVARLEAALPEGETLEARLRQGTPVRPATGSIGRRAPTPETKACVEPVQSSPLACAPPMPLAPWPLVSVGGLGLTLPERPPTLGTPAASAARRPTWATTQGYAAPAAKPRRAPGPGAKPTRARGLGAIPKALPAPLARSTSTSRTPAARPPSTCRPTSCSCSTTGARCRPRRAFRPAARCPRASARGSRSKPRAPPTPARGARGPCSTTSATPRPSAGPACPRPERRRPPRGTKRRAGSGRGENRHGPAAGRLAPCGRLQLGSPTRRSER
jgi:hypothetical protein